MLAMPYTFVHISDLHYRTNWEEEVGLVWREFVRDLAEQLPRYPNPHLILSGDLLFAGGDLGAANEFSARVAHDLAPLGLTREKIVCVPGNHDLSRAALTASSLQAPRPPGREDRGGLQQRS